MRIEAKPTMSVDGLVRGHWYRLTYRFEYDDLEMGPIRFHDLRRWRRSLLVLGWFEDGSRFKWLAQDLIKIQEVDKPKTYPV